jgi:nucleoside-diphosphate-sugar epimerase
MIPIRLLDNTKLCDLGWKPKYDLKSGMTNAINWYKNNKHQFNPNSKP